MESIQYRGERPRGRVEPDEPWRGRPKARSWIGRFGGVTLAAAIGFIMAGNEADAAGPAEVSVLDRIDAGAGNRHYPGTRPPLRPAPLIKLPIGHVRPAGWTRRVLELQNAGFHGNLPAISRYLTREDNAWLSPDGRGANGWEEEPYWLKGFQDAAFLLDDEERVQQARVWIEGAIQSQQPDGWFGPGEGRTGIATDLKGREDLWPNMIMLFCLQSYHEQTGDPRVLELMTRYFRYLLELPEEKFLVGYWPKMRGGDLLWSVIWLHSRTGDDWLVELAHKVHRNTARWDEGLINLHNVNIAQGFREPAEYFLVSGDANFLHATERVWRTVRDTYGRVPGGMWGGDENSRPGYDGPRQAVETCGMAEAMLSHEILLSITGDPTWADRCEDVAFNSFPAAFTADMKALRYLTAPNQPQSDHVSKAPGIQNGGPMYCMDPHDHRCCQHNAGHGWPYFVQHLWYAAPGDGLAAVMYAPSVVRARVGEGAGTEVTITEDTRYPFRDSVELRIATPSPVSFPLYLRVPDWCLDAQFRVNGRRLRAESRAGSFVRIQRAWKDGDRVEIRLPMEVEVKPWPENRQTVSVQRGPLTFSLRIEERYERRGGTEEWPSWDIYPDSPWNYGLELPERRSSRAFRVVETDWPADDQPWAVTSAPVRIRATGRRIPEWTLDGRGLVHEVQPGPVISEEPSESITLIPMGAARLRISAFPVIARGSEGNRWVAPEPSRVRASHTWDYDTTEAVVDGIVPSSSGDVNIPRFTWWDHRGTSEWIELQLEEPRQVSAVEVYWFDDTGRGECRLPDSWRLFYRRDERWVPVSSGFEVAKDRFSIAEFPPVTTDALRIEVQLQEGYSGGILEWRVR